MPAMTKGRVMITCRSIASCWACLPVVIRCSLIVFEFNKRTWTPRVDHGNSRAQDAGLGLAIV